MDNDDAMDNKKGKEIEHKQWNEETKKNYQSCVRPLRLFRNGMDRNGMRIRIRNHIMRELRSHPPHLHMTIASCACASNLLARAIRDYVRHANGTNAQPQHSACMYEERHTHTEKTTHTNQHVWEWVIEGAQWCAHRARPYVIRMRQHRVDDATATHPRGIFFSVWLRCDHHAVGCSDIETTVMWTRCWKV